MIVLQRPNTATHRADDCTVSARRVGRPRLRALTSLRFVAAMLIVIAHSAGRFGLPTDFGSPFVLDQAVSFFFILSGFILTYVYPVIPLAAVPRFLRARVARIWPAHLVAFALLFLLAGSHAGRQDGHRIDIALANLLLIHGWVPIKSFFFSYNTVSWSISTELGFYILFPFLLHRWRRSWWWKLLLTFGLVCGLVTLINVTHLPAASGLRETGLLYVNPLGRLFEFTLGMTVALLYRRVVTCTRTRTRTRARVVGTVGEVSAIVFVGVCMANSSRWASMIEHVPWIGAAGAFWFREVGATCGAFAALILVMALERGAVSRFLTARLFVVLGEISFALYLLHPVLLTIFTDHARSFLRVPHLILYAMYWALTLLTAHLVWVMIETPMRRFLVQGTRPSISWSVVRAPLHLAEIAVLASLLVTLVAFAVRPIPIDWGHLDAANCTQVSGWAWDARHPNDAVLVFIYDSDLLLTQARANQDRTDLHGTFGNGLHGFSQSLPASLHDGQRHVLRIRVGADGPDLTGGSPAITCATPNQGFLPLVAP